MFEFAAWLEGEGALASTEAHQTGMHDGVPTVVEPTGAGCDTVAIVP